MAGSNENEEFEFRLRAEKEGTPAAAPPALGSLSSTIPGTPPQPTPPKDEGGFVDTLKGIPGAAVTAATGMVGGAAGNVAAAGREIASRAMGADVPTARLEGQEAGGKVASAMTYEPSPAGERALGKAGKALDATKISGLNPAVPLGVAAPGAFRTVGKALKEAPDAPIGAMKRAVSPAPDVAELARKAEEFGIQIPPHKLADNKFVRLIGEALDSVPASGSVGDKNQAAFNAALGNMIGAEGSKRITRQVFDGAMTKSGKFIGEVAERTPIPVKSGSNFDAALAAQLESAASSGLVDVEKMIGSYVKEIRAAANADGVIDGKAFRRLNTKVGDAVRGMAPGDRKMALSSLQEDMMEVLLENASPADIEPLHAARRQYAIGKTIEPLVAKAPGGDIPPSQLMGVLTRDKAGKARQARGKGGDLGDLADVAQMFLKDQPSSMTTERGVAYGVLGGGAFVEPTTAAGVYGAANLYNRLGPKLTKRMTRLKDMDQNVPMGEQP